MDYLIKSEKIEEIESDAVILGYFEENDEREILKQSNDIFELGDFKGKYKQKLILYNLEGIKAKRVLLVGLGKKDELTSDKVRVMASLGSKHLRGLGVKKIVVEALNDDAQATAEGVILGQYRFDELKTVNLDKLKTLDTVIFTSSEDMKGSFEYGINVAKAQNHARRLAELPSNYATPTYVAEHAKEILSKFENVEVFIHEEKWAEERKMGSFLSVTNGSDRPAKFLEMRYNGGEAGAQPFVLVGKGITFDTGGISLKPSSGMGNMRGDMGGAAAVIGAMYGIIANKLKTNVIGLTPLCENMPSGRATNPSDVVTASNGKTIQVDNTDAEGRLILADALVYAEELNPHTVVDLATLTGSIGVALGNAYMGAFSRSDDLWNEIDKAGKKTHDRFWRMPLDKLYRKQLDTPLADMNNVGGRAGGACTAAMFLSEFIGMERWAHLDIAGNAWTSGVTDYHPKGMTGKPARAMIDLAKSFEK